MRHLADGTLRRLIDEPLAIADRDARHFEECNACQARSAAIEKDATCSARLLDRPLVVDGAEGYSRFRTTVLSNPHRRSTIHVSRHRSWRLIGTPLSAGVTVGVVGAVVASVAAAATLTTVFAPTQLAPVPVSSADVQELTQLTGLDTTTSLGGFDTLSGSKNLSFGTLSWTSSGSPHTVSSLADAESATGLTVSLPTTLPNGVGAVSSYIIKSKVTVNVTFGESAGSALAGSSIVVTLGPAIGVSYGGATNQFGINPLEILTVAQPVATTNGASINQIENFLLSRPGVPKDLAEELRLLGNLQSTLPVPTPAGASSRMVEIDGSHGLVLTDSSNALSGAIWEDHSGVIHAVAGLLDENDLLSVAQQIG